MTAGKKIYAVIGTNVLVSALFSPNGMSNPAVVVRSILSGKVIPLYNGEIIEEYREVLSRDKFHFPPALVESLLIGLIEAGLDTARTKVEDEVFLDADDVVFYEVAMTIEDAYLVTGNIKHFPQKRFVVTPAQMVEIIRSVR